ncbi:MAG: glycine betaine ABC transporter substrate-binding protein [Bacillota bacterium]
MHTQRWLRSTMMTAMMLLALLVLSACGGSSPGAAPADPGSSGAPQAKEKQVIKFSDTQYQSLWINNAIAGFVIEKGYGYPVETVEMTTPIMQQALVKGDVHVTTEMWTANFLDWYNQMVAEKKILPLGIVMDRASQGWYVPAYVVKGDEKRGIKATAPDLKSVADLKKYPTLFADPEEPSKGQLINCITGWQCAKINSIKLKAYGLDGMYNVLEPGASAALDAAIAGAYKKGKPFLTYYWEPTWLVGTYDMIKLEEPAYSKECNDEIQAVLEEKTALSDVSAKAGCAYEDAPVTKAVHPSLQERAPEVVSFLAKYTLKTDDLNKIAAYMENEKASAEETAIHFFRNYPDVWKAWVPADVAAKVEQAIK